MARTFNFADLLELVCAAVPNRTAVICGSTQLNFSDLDRRATKLANALSHQGIGVGDHVGLYLYNSTEYIEAMFACFKLRAVPINVNYRYAGDELRYLFNNADMVAVIYHGVFDQLVKEVAIDCPKLKLQVVVDASGETTGWDYESLLNDGSEDNAAIQRSDDDIFMLYTGGTTGMPKGVIWPHRALFMAALGGLGFNHPDGPCQKAEDAAERAAAGFELKVLVLSPLMHGSAWWSACLTLMSGYTLILNDQRTLVGDYVLDLIERHGVNSLSIVGDAMAIPLTEALDANPDSWDLSSLFQIGSGGAVFSYAQQSALQRHIPQIQILNSFGSSEAGSMGWAEKNDDGSPGGLGNVKRSEFMDVLCQNEEGAWQHCQPGEQQQGIMARSGHIPLGYYKAEEKTAETFVVVEGKRWLLTGDAAILEKDGSITILGRGSNCINTGGEKVFPEEVEAILKQHPAIRDALAIGTPDERFGQAITAVVSCVEPANIELEDVQDFSRQYLAGYKVPRALHVVNEVPRSPSGKPDYAQAIKLAQGGL